jgi:hypothetical protein
MNASDIKVMPQYLPGGIEGRSHYCPPIKTNVTGPSGY